MKLAISLLIIFFTPLSYSKHYDYKRSTYSYTPAPLAKGTKVDILWVIDDSSYSMITHQNRLSEGMQFFYDGLIENQLDFRIAATTTSMSCKSIPSNKGKLIGSVPVITPETPLAVQRLQELIQRGGDGCNAEQGLRAMEIALSRESSTNSDFLRSEATLIVVFISDDKDFSRESVLYYKNFLDVIKGKNTRYYKRWFAGFIGVTKSNNPQCRTYGDYYAKGLRYLDLVEQSGGMSESICQADFDSFLGHLNGTF